MLNPFEDFDSIISGQGVDVLLKSSEDVEASNNRPLLEASQETVSDAILKQVWRLQATFDLLVSKEITLLSLSLLQAHRHEPPITRDQQQELAPAPLHIGQQPSAQGVQRSVPR